MLPPACPPTRPPLRPPLRTRPTRCPPPLPPAWQAVPAAKGELALEDIVGQYLLPPISTTFPANSTTNSTAFWAQTQGLAGFFTLGKTPADLANRLDRCYAEAAAEAPACPNSAAQAAAAKKLGEELARIGAAIEAREKATETTLPRYDLLVPANLPCSTTI